MNEYLSDELASDSDDEKRMYRAERRAERKIKDKRCRQPLPFTRFKYLFEFAKTLYRLSCSP